MIIEKVEGGYIVQFDDHRKVIANAENVANLIVRHMKDVTEQVIKKTQEQQACLNSAT